MKLITFDYICFRQLTSEYLVLIGKLLSGFKTRALCDKHRVVSLK
jgi:hypothetical protein